MFEQLLLPFRSCQAVLFLYCAEQLMCFMANKYYLSYLIY